MGKYKIIFFFACISEITCQKPEIAHGEVMGIQKNTYNRNVKIALKCNQGYEPGIFFVTCNQNGEWDNMRQCTCKYGFIIIQQLVSVHSFDG